MGRQWRGWARRISVLAAALAALACGDADSDRPNIIVLVSDDQGFGDYGFMGHPYVQTPSLDRLAERGVVFEQARTTSSLCLPSVTSLLTGLDPIQWRYELLWQQFIDPEYSRDGSIGRVPTLPRLLGEAGYATLQAGKLFGASFREAGFSHGTAKTADWQLDGAGGHDGTEVGRATMAPVIDFIDEQRDGPFFIYFAPLIPHLPHDPPDRLLALYDAPELSESARRYFAMCTWYDERVGEIVAALEERGLLENTLIVHLADNGWQQPPTIDASAYLAGAVLGGPKGKGSLHELGLRTPIVVSWPAALEARRDDRALVSTLDLLPTLLDVAGAEPPAPSAAAITGRSLRPLLRDGQPLGRDVLVSGFELLRGDERDPEGGYRLSTNERGYSLRSAEWSYLHYVDRGIEQLFEIELDPHEDHDVAGTHPEVVAGLRARVEVYRRALTDPYLALARREVRRHPIAAATLSACVRDDTPTRACRARYREARAARRRAVPRS